MREEEDSMQTIESIVIMQDGKLTVPAEIREKFSLSDGCKVMFIADGKDIRIVNPAIYAMQEAQKTMADAAEEAGLYTEDDIVALVKEVRAELAEERAAKKNESVYRHEYSDFLHNMA